MRLGPVASRRRPARARRPRSRCVRARARCPRRGRPRAAASSEGPTAGLHLGTGRSWAIACLLVLSRSIADKVAVVTGAASGMGRAVAQLFTAEGAHVAATDRNDEGLAGEGTWELDVSEAGSVERVVAEIVEQLGEVDILVNCAGVSVPAPITADDYWRAWDVTLGVNLGGCARMIRACVPHLTRSAAGRIVNIASTEGLGATPF